MASDLSAYLGNTLLRWLNGDAAMPSSPAGLYVALFNGNPKTTGTENSATLSTGRMQATFGSLASGTSHLLTSSAAVNFGNALADGTLTHLALYDAVSGGNLIASKALPGGTQAIKTGSSITFASGAITFNIGSDS